MRRRGRRQVRLREAHRLSLADGKVTIEKNNTNNDLRRELVKQGIPDEDIQ